MPRPQPEHVDVTFYATIVPEWSANARDEQGRPVLQGAKVDKVTQNRPERATRAGTIVTRLTLRVEAAALLPLQPEAVIHIKAGDAAVIEVVAEDPAYPTDPEETPDATV
jgi:hypothetical protein